MAARPTYYFITDWRKINVNFEEKIKTTYKEVTENSNASMKNLKSELKNKLRWHWNVDKKILKSVEKFDTIDVVRLYASC